MAEETTNDYIIPISDSMLNNSGFSEFELPVTNKNKSFMCIRNAEGKNIIFCPFYRLDLVKTSKSIQSELLAEKLVDEETAKGLALYFENECKVRLQEKDPDFRFFDNGNGNGKATAKNSNSNKEEQQQKIKKTFVQRYTARDNNLIAEAIIVAGRPCFAMAQLKATEVSITLQDEIQINNNNMTTIVKPLEFQSYINKPYTFKSKQEFEQVVENTKTKNLDTLYKKVKSIWNKYVDADNFHISLCAADTIFSYFQDKIGLTHYLFFVGGNASGKTNNLTVLHFLAYRNMISSDVTSANIFQFLGSGEEGIGTICEDEADNVDEDHDKMRIYKNGNTTGIPIFRTDTSFGRTQLRFNTFCFKAFAAERLPDSVKAKGFNQRIIELPCAYGFPQYDISEVANPAGEEKYEELLEELNTMRNILLVYRLLHFQSKIADIKLNIDNREKQLFKPILRVFQDAKTTLKELLPVISKYVSQKRESNANTLHAYLYRLVKDLIKAQKTTELEISLIWNTIINTLSGSSNPNKPQSYESTEYNTISKKRIIETLIQAFGARPSRDRKSRKLIFDEIKLQRLSKIYDLDIDVKVGTSGVTDVTDVTDVGLDRHLNEQLNDNKIEDSEQENQNLHDKTAENIENITSNCNDKSVNRSSDASHASPRPKQLASEQEESSSFSSVLLFKCFYCDECFDGKDGNGCNIKRVNHIDVEHPGKPHYPSDDAFRNRLEK